MLGVYYIFIVVVITHLVHATGPPYDAVLLHPRTGDTVYAGRQFVVTWTIDTSFSDLNLYILGDGYNLEIATGIPNTGSWEWNVETNWPSTTSIYMVLNRADWKRYFPVPNGRGCGSEHHSSDVPLPPFILLI